MRGKAQRKPARRKRACTTENLVKIGPVYIRSQIIGL